MIKQYLLPFCCSLMMMSPLLTAQQEVLDRVVAVVGKETVLLSEMKAELEFYAFNLQTDPNTPGLAEKTLDALVDQKLILAKAQDDTTLFVTEDEVDRSLEGMIAQRSQQAGSERRLEEMYGMTIGRMRREWRDEMRKYILAEKLSKKKTSEVQCSRREVEEFFALYKDSLPLVKEELELYHIFKVPVISDAVRKTVMTQAQAILDSVKTGGNFATYAKEFSIDAGSGVNGGDLGWVRRGEFVKEFEEAAFALKDSQFADLIETKFGVHIIQLLERRGEAIHTRHILFRMERDSSSINETINFLSSLKDSVKNGTSFSELAKRYSEDKESALLGGLIGAYPIDQFDDAVIVAISDLKEGDISEPYVVADGNTKGYHIVWLKKRVPEHKINLADDWKRVEQLAVGYKGNKVYREWLKQLREEIYWETRL
ncbi:MAG: peptidylprolyl isomerase [Ignavibacteriae bacterium]|nr:peptidylprolyl isomerase [Ignavibacteriota bacterium]